MTPIALFAYNRPHHLRLAIESLQRCEGFSECPFHIFCDGPKDEDLSAVHHVADSSGAEVTVRPRNWGFGNLVRGVGEMCDMYGRVIVLEDDHIVSPDFLLYMRSALARYEHEEQVWTVNGHMYPNVHPESPAAFFLSMAFPNTWATWGRAWRHFEWQPTGWQKLLTRRRRFDFNGQWRIARWVTDAMQGRLACWDPQWAYCLFKAKALGLFPCRPLVWNSGLLSGVHGHLTDKDCHADQRGAAAFLEPQLPEGWTLPDCIAPNRAAYRRMARFFFHQRRQTKY